MLVLILGALFVVGGAISWRGLKRGHMGLYLVGIAIMALTVPVAVVGSIDPDPECENSLTEILVNAGGTYYCVDVNDTDGWVEVE